MVNTIVRMFTKKAVKKAMQSAKSVGGAKANRGKRGGVKKKCAKTGQDMP